MKTIAQRFWSKVVLDEKTDCLIWTASLNSNGYGQIALKCAGSKRPYGAHRLAYEMFIGPIPKHLQLDHLCRNRRCVNPAHVEAVTRRENILRGVAPSAIAARKTHCPQGHAYFGDNLEIKKGGHRRCKTCHAAGMKLYIKRRQERPKKEY